MRAERWPAATVLALCVVAALMGLGMAKERAADVGEPNPWLMPN